MKNKKVKRDLLGQCFDLENKINRLTQKYAPKTPETKLPETKLPETKLPEIETVYKSKLRTPLGFMKQQSVWEKPIQNYNDPNRREF